jgi:hypothetical protein
MVRAWRSWSAKKSSEDDGLVRDVVVVIETWYERVIELCLGNEHQDEREEPGLSSASDGHASGADGSQDRDRGRRVEVEAALSSRGDGDLRDDAPTAEEILRVGVPDVRGGEPLGHPALDAAPMTARNELVSTLRVMQATVNQTQGQVRMTALRSYSWG